jgi:ABC-2 type transport system permease protein
MNPTRYNGAGARRDPGFLRRMWAMVVKEFVQMRRDRMTFATMLVIPILQLVLFGYAINTDVRHLPTVVYDQDRSAASRDLARSMEATGYYDLVGHVTSYAEIERAMTNHITNTTYINPL